MTEEIEAIARRLVVGHKRDGRSIYDPQARSDLVQASRQPGVSLARIARTCGINANVLSNWVRQHERGKCGAAAPRAKSSRCRRHRPSWRSRSIRRAGAGASGPGTGLQVRLPNGTTLDLRGADLDDVLKLIEGLGRLRCSASTKP
jgi:transposase